ncbi:MAG: DUF4129 domain-containing protein [Fimbriimonas ginsengisoli]|nr:DUF4129 domain-containing protein [Fimbriimonas ginsengisoli]
MAAFAPADFRTLSRRLEGAKTVEDAVRLVRSDPVAAKDGELLRKLREGESLPADRRFEQLKSEIGLRARFEVDPLSTHAPALAAEIKRSPMYRGLQEKQSANWLAGALERFAKLFEFKKKPPNLNMPNFGPLDWIIPIMWTLLGFGVLFFLYLIARQFAINRSAKRKARAMLEEEEPERTLDEWLTMADQLEAEGRHREAVRCLYLACLLRFDEANVARFERSQTNWEHLRRIDASPRKPAGLDFRTPTRAFDDIWYGMRCKGWEDVAEFRSCYLLVTGALEAKAA